MILMDTEHNVYTDSSDPVSDAIKESMVRAGYLCEKYDDNTLYNIQGNGDVSIYSITPPKFHAVKLTREEVTSLKLQGKVYTEQAAVRDVGLGRLAVYLDTGFFYAPMGILDK